MPMQRILLMNGPNLDMLGKREPDVYGTATLAYLEEMAMLYAGRRGATLACFQSNSESQLIKRIHEAEGAYDGIVYNPGAHTHYSYALRDAVASIDVPVVEVHISDVDGREEFRRTSVIAPVCIAQVKGLGLEGYCRAIDILCESKGFARLGEDYKTRFPEGAHVLVAESPVLSGGTAELPAASVGTPADGPDRFPAGNTVAESAAVEAPSENPTELDDAQLPAGNANEDRLPAGNVINAVGAQLSAQLPAGNSLGAQLPAGNLLGNPLADSGSAAHATGSMVAEAPPENFAEPYADDVAAVDLGLISHERQAAVRIACGQLGLDAILVRDTPNIQWVTAFDGVFDDERAHALLIADGRTVLHTDSRYANAVRAVAAGIGSDVQVDDGRVGHARFAKDSLLTDGAAFTGRLGIEDSITYAEFVKLVEAFGADRLAATTDVVIGLRAVKTGPELSRMLAAQAVTDAAFEHIVAFMRPGMTERQVQLELESYMLRHGAEGLAFRSIVATGANGADPHAVPGDTRLEAGQCVVMDFGAKAFGYCSDMTRMVFLGRPEGRMAAAWEALRCANEAVESMLRPGVTGKEAHELAERVLADGGFGGTMGHGLGHGVGIEVHELPVLNARNDKPLAIGNVVTVEPGIYLPGEFGMRLEDCGVITAVGYEVFSEIGHEMVVV